MAEGSFTIAADRAKRLLAERVLSDPWQAWLCLFQAFHRGGATSMAIEVGQQRVDIQLEGDRSASKSIQELMTDDRFLLAWLNLDWFGQTGWRADLGKFSLIWKGSIIKRFNLMRNLRSLLRSSLLYSPRVILLEGASITSSTLPKAKHYTVFTGGEKQSLAYRTSSTESQSDYKVCQISPESNFTAALAYRSGKSWSQAKWVHHGVLIKEERNTLERPGLSLIASVDALSLETDLSGFGLIHDEKYLDFANKLKKEVLWML